MRTALHEGIPVPGSELLAAGDNGAMYYPADERVSKKVDPDSKTPTFKSVLVTIEPESPVSRGKRAPVHPDVRAVV